MLVTLIVRAVYLIQFVRSPMFGYLRADQRYYFQWAQEIAAGHWLGKEVFEQAPLYPYLLGIAFSIVGERIVLVLMAQLLLGALSCALLYKCGERLFGKPTGVVAGLLMATYGPELFYEGMILKSFLSPVLTTVALYAALCYRDRQQASRLWLIGAAVGLACLERECHILLMLPITVWIWQTPLPSLSGMKTRFSRLCQLAVGFGLMLVPSTLHNFTVGGQFVAVTAGGGEVFYIAHGADAKGFYSAPQFVTGNPFLEHEDFRREAERRTGQKLTRGESSRFWFGEAKRSVLANPMRTLRLTGEKFVILFNDYEVPDGENFTVTRRFVSLLKVLPTFAWIGGLGLVGIAVSLLRIRSAWLVVAFAGIHAFTVLLLYNFGRFRIGMMPPWILLAAAALTWVISPSQTRSLKSVSLKLASILSVGLISLVMFRYPFGNLPPGHLAAQEIATADLAMIGGNPKLAAPAYERVIEIYSGFDRRVPKISRLMTQSHLGLASIHRENGDLNSAARHLKDARSLPNRDDFKRVVLQQWVELLEQAVAESAVIEGVPDPQAELANLRLQLESAAKP